jgi:6-phosphogluconate dehydrogenase
LKIGLIGLGKMGSNMTKRLLKDNHEVVVFDMNDEAIQKAEEGGAVGASSLDELLSKLPERKVVWIMVPSGDPVDQTIQGLQNGLKEGDILIDGGNSNWHDSMKRAEGVKNYGIHYIDCGVSGGVWGLEEGYCLMYGGVKEACDYVEPIFKSLAPDKEHGFQYCGQSGSGHFVKMVHNGIEYGMMEAYAEGFELLENAPFDLDLHAISKVWQYGSVIRSWLLELLERALKEDPEMEDLEAFVQDSGEGRWTVHAAIELGIPVPVITQSLFSRFQSRDPDSFGFKLLAALRNQFGGHAVKKK